MKARNVCHPFFGGLYSFEHIMEFSLVVIGQFSPTKTDSMIRPVTWDQDNPCLSTENPMFEKLYICFPSTLHYLVCLEIITSDICICWRWWLSQHFSNQWVADIRLQLLVGISRSNILFPVFSLGFRGATFNTCGFCSTLLWKGQIWILGPKSQSNANISNLKRCWDVHLSSLGDGYIKQFWPVACVLFSLIQPIPNSLISCNIL